MQQNKAKQNTTAFSLKTTACIMGLAMCVLGIACALTPRGLSPNPVPISDTCDDTETEVLRKPVVYLYPTRDNLIVDVHLNFKGEVLALDPDFNLPDGWRVIADHDGTIHYDDNTYPYLFWEGDPFFTFDFYSGFCIEGKNTEAFLKESMPQLGLNEKETKDFISYWLPKMKDNKYNVISFQAKTYTENAELTIEPAPDTINRVFMAWYPSDKLIRIPQQLLPKAPQRTGFTVVEWGGAEVKP